MERAPFDEIEQLLAELGKRMEEYVVCMRELPRVSHKLKLDVWRIASRKHDEMDVLHARALQALGAALGAVLPGLDPVTVWISGGHHNAGDVIAAWQALAGALPDPATRSFATEWLARARAYAEVGRPAQMVACMQNARIVIAPWGCHTAPAK